MCLVELVSLTESIRLRARTLHISCHGTKGEDILQVESVDPPGLECAISYALFDALNQWVKSFDLVFISACYSGNLAQKFSDAGVKHVISVEKSEPINDVVASEFSERFYKHLFMGGAMPCSVRQAFDQAQHEVCFLSIPLRGKSVKSEVEKFKLLSRADDRKPFIDFLPAGDVVDESSRRPWHCGQPWYHGLPVNEPYFNLAQVQTEAFKIIEEMHKSKATFFNICGRRGVGKSSLLAECAAYLYERGRDFAWIPCSPVEDGLRPPEPSFHSSFLDSENSLAMYIARSFNLDCAVSSLDELMSCLVTEREFRRRQYRWVLFDDLDLLSPGQRVLLFGPNGMLSKTKFPKCEIRVRT